MTCMFSLVFEAFDFFTAFREIDLLKLSNSVLETIRSIKRQRIIGIARLILFMQLVEPRVHGHPYIHRHALLPLKSGSKVPID